MSVLQNPEIYHTVLESLQTGVCVVDPNRRIVLWNQGAAHSSGYMSHEMIGRNCHDILLFHCNAASAEECKPDCPLTRIMHEGKPIEVGVLLRHKRGHCVPVRMRLAPLRDPHGSIIAIAGSFETLGARGQREHDQHNQVPPGGLDIATGIANHGFTQFHLRESLASFAEYHIPFGVLCVRPDGLEQFRATWGREASAAILLVVAQTLSNSFRPGDFVGRWTEEEILVILANCGSAGVQSVAERIRKIIASTEIRWWGEQLSLTSSLGWASVEAGDTIDALVQRAERSLHSLAPTASTAGGCGS